MLLLPLFIIIIVPVPVVVVVAVFLVALYLYYNMIYRHILFNDLNEMCGKIYVHSARSIEATGQLLQRKFGLKTEDCVFSRRLPHRRRHLQKQACPRRTQNEFLVSRAHCYRYYMTSILFGFYIASHTHIRFLLSSMRKT